MRNWKRFIRKFISNDTNYAYYIFKQADKDYQSEIRRLRSSGLTRQQIDESISPWIGDVEICYCEYKEVRSRKWEQEAIKLSVLFPNHPLEQYTLDDPSGYWEFLSSIGRWVLTDKGIHHIRHEIREVQKVEHERRLRWTMPLIAVLALIVSVISVSNTCLS